MITGTGHVLILGGTTEARQLARTLAPVPLLRVTTSLAGRVTQPRMPDGEIRVGGFGGPGPMAAWLSRHEVAAVIDATHPFAAVISANAAAAAAAAGIPLVALRRPGWQPGPGDRWYYADGLDHAAALLAGLGRRVFLTTGRLGLAAFAGLDGLHFLVRSVEAPEPPLPLHTELLLDRGPYTVEGERELLRTYAADVLVTKDSGGPATAAKLTAARELGLPVVVVRRPPAPPGVRTVADVAGALAELERLGCLSPGAGPDAIPGAADTCP
ncbi:cobalt-precorrin-6A reductase [Streptomyces sp. ISL-100]|uniref:cobalt-precorrin-6A reductase n=1 Tax=Streptomyces sp. ISL-100 TaxID=2819173 RepID=UPI001BE634DB|nr:cobalt-precorrin-6A reductase [Streptomyces sp. ISL-100]MBT2398295.1 cobalt-precorrin-6A reductase [Streptomyces sp. ISL-100]